MTEVIVTDGFLEDLERITAHLVEHGVEGIEQRLEEIFDAAEILRRHPHVGRPLDSGHRELVIGRGSRGYVALYRVDDEADAIILLAVRAQRERGFRR
jgi:toxin ParE1/3/4